MRHTRAAWWEGCSNTVDYYSFIIFPRFWLAKTTRIIHHNQLLLAKFKKNLCHIESMTWKVHPAADCWAVDREHLGIVLVLFWWAEKQRAKWRSSFNNGKMFQIWLCRIWRILQISESVKHLGLLPLWITPLLICRILLILLSLIQ